MSKYSRRDFIKAGAAVGAAGIAAGFTPFAIGGSHGSKKVVIVGGGMGGATAAKYIRMMDPSISVTLIETNRSYFTCFLSNEVLSGTREMDTLMVGYKGLEAHGVKVVIDMVTSIDANGQMVKTKGGDSFKYDRCIVSPGVDFKWDTIEGYDASVAENTPHAWKAGPQTVTLRKQLEAMPNGGTVIIAPPPNPFRCPPGPGERISQMAHYLKNNKPKSKILAFDPKGGFSKKGLFVSGWARHYGFNAESMSGGLIDYTLKDGVVAYDAATKTVTTQSGAKIKGDVVNIIPAQKAGMIAASSGLTNDKGWCPIDGLTFESTIHKGIHVLGDAAIAFKMPKSAYAANSQAKVCASAVVAMLNGQEAPEPSYVNTCYSIIAPGDGISVAAIYKLVDGQIVPVKDSGGLTPGYDKTTMEMRAREVEYAYSWFKNITHDCFG
jgi:sulfide dehydrogenase [flavocytochrome c] flavoprotein subunit